MEQMTTICDLVGQVMQKRQEEEKRIAEEKEAAELEAKCKIQECLNIEEKSIPQASTRSRKFRIDPTLSNFTISTKRIPFSEFNVPPVETVNSPRMGDKHLDTQKGSLESSVKDPIPTPSESANLSDGESECDVPINDDSPESHFSTFDNPIFDSNDDFSSNDESLSEEEIQKDEFKYFSNPLYDLDDEIITNEKILPNQKDLDEIIPIPPGIDERDILPLEELLDNVLSPFPESDDFTIDVEPVAAVTNDFDVLNNDEPFDPGGGGNIVLPNVEEGDTFTLSIRTFLPFVTYPEDYPDFEDSRALGFVHSYSRASYPQLHLGDPIS
ncbi:hypothetical protein Tco_0072322 [Tanacetum coccineum]